MDGRKNRLKTGRIVAIVVIGLVIFIGYKIISFMMYNWNHAADLPHHYQIELGYEFDMETLKIVEPVTILTKKDDIWVDLAFPHELKDRYQGFKITEVKTGKTVYRDDWYTLTNHWSHLLEVRNWKRGKYRCSFVVDGKELATKTFKIE
jgi:hypothetical protein